MLTAHASGTGIVSRKVLRRNGGGEDHLSKRRMSNGPGMSLGTAQDRSLGSGQVGQASRPAARCWNPAFQNSTCDVSSSTPLPQPSCGEIHHSLAGSEEERVP